GLGNSEPPEGLRSNVQVTTQRPSGLTSTPAGHASWSLDHQAVTLKSSQVLPPSSSSDANRERSPAPLAVPNAARSADVSVYPTESDDWRFPPATVIVSLFPDREHATRYVWP